VATASLNSSTRQQAATVAATQEAERWQKAPREVEQDLLFVSPANGGTLRIKPKLNV
jgi:hypothetical protein